METTTHKVLMTPLTVGTTKTIRVERVPNVDESHVHHIGRGQHAGIFINKEPEKPTGIYDIPEMQFEFSCVMANHRTSEKYAENRRLKFWFAKSTQQFDMREESYQFFRELISPASFPRGYAGFIKKVIKQMHGQQYVRLQRVELDLIRLDRHEQDALVPERDTRPKEVVIRDALQMRLEEAYPNVLSMDDLIRILEVNDGDLLCPQLKELCTRDLIEKIPLEGKSFGLYGYRRKIHLQNQEVREVKGANHMKQLSTCEKPTIAIITNLLCEKLAVDAMIEEKTTFVRYKTEGESHVYTIGNIGTHRVISTKLPMVGRELQAKISSGSITTRLLGAFQAVQHVFLVGVGGSVPHMCEFEKHSRLGDIVVSAPSNAGACRSPGTANNSDSHPLAPPQHDGPVYLCFEHLVEPEEGAPANTAIKFDLKKYAARSPILLNTVNQVLDQFEADPCQCEWAQILTNTLAAMTGKNETVDFTSPPSDTDKLRVKTNDGITMDIKHPTIPEELAVYYKPGVPAVRLGCIGAGRQVTDSDRFRDIFAADNHLLAFDSEYDQVLESVLGNGLDSFLLIRGIADYAEGRQGTQWQAYAALAAAAFMKTIILHLPLAFNHDS